MADYVKRIRTEAGDLQIDYESLANLPVSDTTLTQSGKFADAQATGERIKNIASTIKPEDIGALPDTYTPPVTSVNGQTGAVNITVPNVPVTSVDGKTGDVQTGAYTADNPPPYPVTSVNGQTGAIDNVAIATCGTYENARYVYFKHNDSDIMFSINENGDIYVYNGSNYICSAYTQNNLQFSLSGTALTITIP